MSKRFNPRSLVALVAMLVEHRYDGNVLRLARSWLRHIENTPRDRFKGVGRTERNLRDIASNLLNDETSLKYWHLESLAHMNDMPTGVFLLFSRILHNWNAEKPEDTVAIAHALRQIADTIDPNTTPDFEMFKAWVGIMKELKIKP